MLLARATLLLRQGDCLGAIDDLKEVWHAVPDHSEYISCQLAVISKRLRALSSSRCSTKVVLLDPDTHKVEEFDRRTIQRDGQECQN